jgi:phage terminase large subunit
LGGRAGISAKQGKYGGKVCLMSYRVRLSLPAGVAPFRLSRKSAIYTPDVTSTQFQQSRNRYVLDVKPVGTDEAVCIKVAHTSGLFVTRGHIVTHNTAMLNWLSLWFPMTRPDARVIVTAPSSAQLEDAYIPGFRQWSQNLPPDVYQLWQITADRFVFKMAERQGFENFVTVRTARADSPESLQGVNAKHVLVLVDEAAGVADINFEAISGSLAADNASLVLTGNPNRNTGYFCDTHTKLAEHWHTLHVNSEDSRLVAKEWIEECRLKWGRDSNQYRIHVLGEFPTEEEDTVIPVHLVESAMLRDIDPFGATVWGVDVARYGSDLSALCKRRGNTVAEPVRTWAKLDTMELTGRIKNEWDVTPAPKRPRDIFVDVIGIGSGVVDRLRELGLPARGVNVSESPALRQRYDRLRDQLWFDTREWLEGLDVTLPKDERLREELITPRIGYTSTGKLKVESKDKMRARGKTSPNAADSLILTFAATAATAMGKRHDRTKPLHRGIRGIV